MGNLTQAPRVRELDRSDIDSILTRNAVGRLAFGWGGRVDIRPIHYIYSEGRIYGRTSYGDKFEAVKIPLPAAVAFEVDEIETLWCWRSVIVHGDFRVLTPDGAGREEWNHATELLRRLVQQTFMSDDPFPDRNLIFRIEIGEVTGRAMR